MGRTSRYIDPGDQQGQFVVNSHIDAEHDFLTIHTAKLKNRLREREDAQKIRRSWWAPLGIFVTIAGTFATADFQKSFGIAAEVWSAFFMWGALFSMAFVASSIYQSRRHAQEPLGEFISKMVREMDGKKDPRPSSPEERGDQSLESE